MNELKACPFCNVNEWKYQSHFSGTTIYQCEKCGTIVEEWVINTRPIEDALNARISELSQAVGLITTLKPTMVMDANHPLDMAKEVVEYMTTIIANTQQANRGLCANYIYELNENIKLTARIAELEEENAELKERVAMLDVTAVFKSLGEMGYIEQVDKLIARNTKLEEFVNELIETRRIRIVSNGELPEAKESVLALVKEKWSGELYIERACYIPPKSIRADDFFLDDLEDESVEEYDEELDLYWVAEGWWEDSHEANVNWKITGEVIGWWELPKIEVEAKLEVQE